ncbi:MAG: LicD family protein [Proteobacteria bacterium]|nr:LicD family protein [Pseudomonadota bacterium]
MPQTENRRYGVPVGMVLPTGTIELEEKMVSCPKDPDAFLRAMYGNYTNVEYTYVDDHAAFSRKNVDETGCT